MSRAHRRLRRGLYPTTNPKFCSNVAVISFWYFFATTLTVLGSSPNIGPQFGGPSSASDDGSPNRAGRSKVGY
jgi:hypothetical protein